MIFLADDYLVKYCDSLGYLISRSVQARYSYSYIERTLSYSKVLSNLEKSNITDIAFSSFEKIYQETFPLTNNDGFIYDPYDQYAWAGYIYIHLFLDLSITFEALFYIIPIDEMLYQYDIYHEMDYKEMLDYVKEKMNHSILDIIMKRQDVSTSYLSQITGISFSTINALRYNKRDISKLEAKKLLALSNKLNVKMETLLDDILLETVL